MVAKHDSWIKDNAVDLYQAAYDGELDEIEQRDKARDGGTENKLVSDNVCGMYEDTAMLLPPFYTPDFSRSKAVALPVFGSMFRAALISKNRAITKSSCGTCPGLRGSAFAGT